MLINKKEQSNSPCGIELPRRSALNTHTPPRYFRDNRQSCEFLLIINQSGDFVKGKQMFFHRKTCCFQSLSRGEHSARIYMDISLLSEGATPPPTVKSSTLYSTLPPLTVRRNLHPSISAAPRHIIIRARKMSKYSYMVQISSSTCKFREIFFSAGSTFKLEPVTA